MCLIFVRRAYLYPVILLVTMTAAATSALATPRLIKADYSALTRWSEDVAAGGVRALRASCLVKAGKQDGLTAYGKTISAAKWQRLCSDLAHIREGEEKAFVETHFTPYLVHTDFETTGLLTGYFTPTLEGSLTRHDRFQIPVYGRPDEGLRTRFTRQQIEQGALADKGLEILWLEDAIDAFFLHVQGSGYVTLPDGEMKKLVFAGKNDFPYTAIGKQFVADGIVSAQDMSMQWLKQWLRSHPDQVASVMQRNQSYIFFALSDAREQVKGAEGSPLTPWHSVAIDPAFMEYGVPLYVDDGDAFATMAIAQDTGSAIRGAMRGDLYLGIGEEAGERAGGLKAKARFYVLLPH